MAVLTTIVTNKGLTLQNKQVQGADLILTKAVSGSSSVSLVDLRNQTEVKSIEQTLVIESLKQDASEHSYTLLVRLDNQGLEKAYQLRQIGIYANDPDEGEILFALAQLDVAKTIGSEAEAPGYTLQVNFVFQNNNEANIVVNYDDSKFVTREGVLAITGSMQESIDKKFEIVEMDSESYVAVENRVSNARYYNLNATTSVSNGTSTVSNMMLV